MINVENLSKQGIAPERTGCVTYSVLHLDAPSPGSAGIFARQVCRRRAPARLSIFKLDVRALGALKAGKDAKRSQVYVFANRSKAVREQVS